MQGIAALTSGGASLQEDRAGKAPSNAAVSFAADAAASSPVAQQRKSAAGADILRTRNHSSDLNDFKAQQLVRCILSCGAGNTTNANAGSALHAVF